jgi:gluconate 5-dehydrogenase
VTPDAFSLKGRRALLTGATRGIGLAIARGLGAAGASLVINDVTDERMEAALSALHAQGFAAEGAVFDVADERAVEQAVAGLEASGPLDILINNAGIQKRATLMEISATDFSRIVDVHLKGCFLVGRAVARGMIARGHGKIVNIASIQAQVARARVGPYSAAKTAIRSLTQTMAAEWAPLGLNVNAIGPGYTATEFTDELTRNAEFTAWVEARTPGRRWGRPEDMAGAAVFLCSEAAAFVNGHLLIVDGGLTAVQ